MTQRQKRNSTPRTGLGRAKINYARAVAVGGYNSNKGGLRGKHDNVRVFWEDQTRRKLVRPHLEALRTELGIRPVRVLDLGCGAGQGFDLLTQIERNPRSVELHHDWILPAEDIDYTGVDLSEDMVEKGRENFAGCDNIRFFQGDLNEGLGALRKEPPFDIYFSSYGSFSHLSARRLHGLLSEIVEHARPGALIVLDLNARYSIEWPGYWNARAESGKVRDYTMNYLYLGDPAAMAAAEHFPLRFWTGEEVRDLVASVGSSDGGLEVKELIDCSVLVGRHVDTREYNPELKPWRGLVNSLHQDFIRTDLSKLRIDPDIAGRHRIVTPFLQTLIAAWNTLIDFTRLRLKHPVGLFDLKAWTEYPPCLQFALTGMDRVIADAQWMHYGDPRANFIEPQLGYMLRNLELNLQRGLGCGHALLALLRKSPRE